MAAGQFDSDQIGCIIQARMNSTRLPGKILLPLPYPEGKPLIGLIIEQVKEVIPSQNIIVATSYLQENNRIEEYCEGQGIKCFRGSEENVISRFIEIQRLYQFEHLVRLTADNPFIDTGIFSDFLQWHKQGDFDYSCTEGLPLGMNMEVFKGCALIESLLYVQSDFDKEHVTPALKREKVFKKGYYKTGYDYSDSVRLTVDTAIDFHVASTVLHLCFIKGLRGVDLVRDLLKHEPWVLEGNKQVIQKNRFSNPMEEINSAMALLQHLEYFNAADLLKIGFDYSKG